jgi:protein-S-isoprenylcysteine O-methyltransferase Ste14
MRFVLFALIHSLCAMECTKRFLNRIHSKEARFHRISYNLVSLAMFGWVMSAYRSSPVLYFAPGIWSLLLYAAQLAVASVLLLCVRQTGAGDFLGISQLRGNDVTHQTLVTNGCYAYMRHPLYFYSLLFMVLNPVMTGQWVLLTVLSLIYFIAGAIIEERRLVQAFGEEYLDYQRRVPFLIPARRKNEGHGSKK